jgi:hypothetical protein|nr:MAG TPA: holin [Caudoviricetes sp.]
MMDWQGIVLTVVGTVVTALMAWLTTWLTGLIKAKTKDTKLQGYLTSALQAVNSVVAAVQQTVVDGIKGTDKWTPEAQKQILQDAIEKAKAQISAEAQGQLASTFGDFDEWLVTQIEAAIKNLKGGK